MASPASPISSALDLDLVQTEALNFLRLSTSHDLTLRDLKAEIEALRVAHEGSGGAGAGAGAGAGTVGVGDMEAEVAAFSADAGAVSPSPKVSPPALFSPLAGSSSSSSNSSSSSSRIRKLEHLMATQSKSLGSLSARLVDVENAQVQLQGQVCACAMCMACMACMACMSCVSCVSCMSCVPLMQLRYETTNLTPPTPHPHTYLRYRPCCKRWPTTNAVACKPCIC